MLKLEVVGKIDQKGKIKIPMMSQTVSAGFPSPAEDYTEKSIDLNDELIANKQATFFIRVSGTSMTDSNIKHGDVLIVDKSIAPQNNSIVIALLDGEFTVKRLKIDGKKIYLQPENPAFKTIEVTTEMMVWGVVTYIIHKAV